MPPRRGPKKPAATALPPSPPILPLNACTVALSGTFPNTTHGEIKDQLAELGAAVTAVTNLTTHLITTQADFDKPSPKVSAARGKGLLIVGLQWLHDCLNSRDRVPEQPFVFGGGAAIAHTPPTDSAPEAKAAGKRPASPIQIDASSDASPVKKKAKANATNGTQVPNKARDEVAVGQVAKSRDLQVPLDEGCPLASYAVYIDDYKVIWDASLNQTNSSNNNNKFYRIQLLHNGAGDYKTWTRWGRVGDRGHTKILGTGSLHDAIKMFNAKFKDKSGLGWAQRGQDPRKGKYAFVERSYNQDSDDDDVDAAEGSAQQGKGKEIWEPPKCTLAAPVQQLVELIFNRQYFAATMTELNYDANKLPLGKLSKATITRGFQFLKDLSALLDDDTLAESEYGQSIAEATEDLSNRFYSLIPHAFGRNRPPIIRDYAMLKKEIELLESLGDMKDAELIMKVDQAKVDIHPLDRQYAGLGMKEMTPLDPSGAEFGGLKECLVSTCGSTHHVQYQVEDIFRIERAGEHDRFHQSSFSGPPRDRRLLWHGSRATNFGGILSQGLRIAPPEAPVSGYMFGKGIYLADMSSKSANYCCPYISGGTALLLLCEAELGVPMQELTDASYSAGDDAKAKGMLSTLGQGQTGPKVWKDAACLHPDLAGVRMPDVSTPPGDTDIPSAWLLYNEYIVYDVAQVRLRYLFRVKM